ncbi:Lrp/AsnC family transcriptional regulator [Candidatus Woesearchaeota archaeon]|nr:Lrp/AsnC family transcriptional regulator [Candidatus Woesearchaeota archaeon]
MEIDNKDKQLLEILQVDGRKSLTELAKAIKLSIDSTHKRIKKLKEKGIVNRFGIFINPKALGYDLVTNIQIKLQNINEEELNRFIAFLKQHKNIIELITTLGDYDLTCVIIAKNTQELEEISINIRQKFRNLIADWKSVINLKVYKFEEYKFT